MPYEYQEYPKYLYHYKLAPEGKVFQNAEQTKGLKRRGWVDTPAKFPKPSRLSRSLNNMKPWWTEWEWAFKALAVILTLIAAILAFVKALRWYP